MAYTKYNQCNSLFYSGIDTSSSSVLLLLCLAFLSSLSTLEPSQSALLLYWWDVVTDADIGICVEKKAYYQK